MRGRLGICEVKGRRREAERELCYPGEETVVTVAGAPAAVIAPSGSARLTAAEVAIDRALSAAIGQLERVCGEFDAVDLVGEGRR